MVVNKDEELSPPEIFELNTQFQTQPGDEEVLWEVIEITAERSQQYKVRWAGTDPDTGQPWPESWVPKHDCTRDLVREWKEKRHSQNKSTKKTGTLSKGTESAETRSRASRTSRTSSESTRTRTGSLSAVNEDQDSLPEATAGSSSKPARPKSSHFKRKLGSEKHSSVDEAQIFDEIPEAGPVKKKRRFEVRANSPASSRQSGLRLKSKAVSQEDDDDTGHQRQSVSEAHEDQPIVTKIGPPRGVKKLSPPYPKSKSKATTPHDTDCSHSKQHKGTLSDQQPKSIDGEPCTIIDLTAESIDAPPFAERTPSAPPPRGANSTGSNSKKSSTSNASEHSEGFPTRIHPPVLSPGAKARLTVFDVMTSDNGAESSHRLTTAFQAQPGVQRHIDDSMLSSFVPETETQSSTNSNERSQLPPPPVKAHAAASKNTPVRPDPPAKILKRLPQISPSAFYPHLHQATDLASAVARRPKRGVEGNHSDPPPSSIESFDSPDKNARRQDKFFEMSEDELLIQSTIRDDSVRSTKAASLALIKQPLRPSVFQRKLALNQRRNSNILPRENAELLSRRNPSKRPDKAFSVPSAKDASDKGKGKERERDVNVDAATNAHVMDIEEAEHEFLDFDGGVHPADDTATQSISIEQATSKGEVFVTALSVALDPREHLRQEEEESTQDLEDEQLAGALRIKATQDGPAKPSAVPSLLDVDAGQSSSLQATFDDLTHSLHPVLSNEDLAIRPVDTQSASSNQFEQKLREVVDLLHLKSDEITDLQRALAIEMAKNAKLESDMQIQAQQGKDEMTRLQSSSSGSGDESEKEKYPRGRRAWDLQRRQWDEEGVEWEKREEHYLSALAYRSQKIKQYGREKLKWEEDRALWEKDCNALHSMKAAWNDNCDAWEADRAACQAHQAEWVVERLAWDRERESSAAKIATLQSTADSLEAKLQSLAAENTSLVLEKDTLQLEKETLAHEVAAEKQGKTSAEQSKASAEQDRDFFREQYSQASGYVSVVRAENIELETKAKIAEGQAKDGLAMYKGMFEEQILRLKTDLTHHKFLVSLYQEQERRTEGEEIRRRAAEHPELLEMCEGLKLEVARAGASVRRLNEAHRRMRHSRDSLSRKVARLRAERSFRMRNIGSTKTDDTTVRDTDRSREPLDDADGSRVDNTNELGWNRSNVYCESSYEGNDGDEVVFRCSWRENGVSHLCDVMFESVQDLEKHVVERHVSRQSS